LSKYKIMKYEKNIPIPDYKKTSYPEAFYSIVKRMYSEMNVNDSIFIEDKEFSDKLYVTMRVMKNIGKVNFIRRKENNGHRFWKAG
jgi:hypothetical protein